MSRITEEILRIVKKLHMTLDDLILETELVESEESYLDELVEDASDWVSDEYGFCNYGIQVEE